MNIPPSTLKCINATGILRGGITGLTLLLQQANAVFCSRKIACLGRRRVKTTGYLYQKAFICTSKGHNKRGVISKRELLLLDLEQELHTTEVDGLISQGK